MITISKSQTHWSLSTCVLLFVAMCSAQSPAHSQGFIGDGGINMGPSGPVGVFNGGNIGAGGVSGSFNTGVFGNGGVSTPSSGGFNFDLGASAPTGPAAMSQARPGARSHQAAQTNTNYQGDSARSNRNNQSLTEVMQHNLLSNESVDLAPVPSASHDFGFKKGGGMVGGGLQLLRRGWILPPTSTSSVDLNVVSP